VFKCSYCNKEFADEDVWKLQCHLKNVHKRVYSLKEVLKKMNVENVETKIKETKTRKVRKVKKTGQCRCGCGTVISANSRFAQGHDARLVSQLMKEKGISHQEAKDEVKKIK